MRRDNSAARSAHDASMRRDDSAGAPTDVRAIEPVDDIAARRNDAATGVGGSIWIDARAIGVVEKIAPSFTAYYLGWLDRLARNQLPDACVPAGRCALANALGGYLGVCEQRLGLAPGTIAGDALRDALAALGAGAIAIAADRSALFADGEPVDPCLACARLVDNLGLGAEVVTPGIRPRPERS
jgi:hypothetical protein